MNKKHILQFYGSIDLSNSAEYDFVEICSGQISNEIVSLNGWLIIGKIRIDNRQELLSKLNIDSNSSICDKQLVLNCFFKWNKDLSNYLSGDFTFTVFSPTCNQIYSSRDHFGIEPFYYYLHNNNFIFGNDINIILERGKINTQLNLNKILTTIVPLSAVQYRNETWFKDIVNLPAGNYLWIEKGEFSKKKYWTPQIGKELIFKNDEEFIEAFQSVFEQSISTRMNSDKPISALLSGGLDSSAIVGMLAKILEKKNQTLNVFSSVLPEDQKTKFKDERYYIDQFKDRSNINIHYVSDSNLGVMSSKLFSETQLINPFFSSRIFLYEAFEEKAKQFGSEIIFDGIRGEIGPSWNANGCYTEMFFGGKWLMLKNELLGNSKLKSRSLINSIGRELVKPIYNSLANNGVISKKTISNVSNSHCLTEEFVRYLFDCKDVNSVIELRKHKGSLFSEKENHLEILRKVQEKANSRQQSPNVEYMLPYTDVRLIEFCLNLPLHYKVRNGYQRFPIRLGLTGLIPEEIQWRISKMPFSPDYYRRYNQQLNLMYTFIDDIPPEDEVRKVVDFVKLKSWLDVKINDNEIRPVEQNIALFLVPSAIFLIQFLRRFKSF